ncbi:hypothetical protein [Streptococcus sobrinus]|uniref:Competence-induced protein Ccs4 n=1 Tax=Streptococcus sobrinus W1703 TaxID=1227275 RepID=U2J807_9STRE|nr:hypothetical protein [Streptococcus sobrinus]ERJ75915.1 hypothetical protein HMPREF1557_01243 [Streptococcus sobrinus W1703]
MIFSIAFYQGETIVANKQEEHITYSRRQADEVKSANSRPTKAKARTSYSIAVASNHRFYIFLFSLVMGLTSVANPLLTDFANPTQMVHLYTGQMMSHGHLPYLDTFATGGFLFYALIALSYFLGSSLWLMVVEFLAFYMSGIYFYKIISFLTSKTDMGMTFTAIFYLLNLALGFGGLYPIQWAFPFILNALWFLTKYFAGHINDEAFIIYGFFGTLAALIDPRSLIFWGLSFIIIGIYNFLQRHFARGFYQLLCMIFGAILVYYTVGFFVLNMGNLSDYVTQALFYNFKVFAVGSDSLLITLPYQILALAGSGLLLGLFGFFGHLGRVLEFKTVKWLSFFTLIFSLIIGIFSQSYFVFSLLLALPFGLILTALVINDRINEGADGNQKETGGTHRRKRTTHESQGGYWATFAKGHFQLPVLVMIVGIATPIVLGVLSVDTNRERKNISNYLKANTSDSSIIYVWDKSSKIYLDTGLQSTSQFPNPVVNTSTKTNSQKRNDDVLQAKARYVVVNKSEKIPSEVSSFLKSNYKKISLDNSDHFTLYQKK